MLRPGARIHLFSWLVLLGDFGLLARMLMMMIDKESKEEGESPHTRILYCSHKGIDKESKLEGRSRHAHSLSVS